MTRKSINTEETDIFTSFHPNKSFLKIDFFDAEFFACSSLISHRRRLINLFCRFLNLDAMEFMKGLEIAYTPLLLNARRKIN
jgi:hypothetical protein